MALYKDSKFIDRSDDASFDAIHKPGEKRADHNAKQ
jgi:hypothetical protein